MAPHRTPTLRRLPFNSNNRTADTEWPLKTGPSTLLSASPGDLAWSTSPGGWHYIPSFQMRKQRCRVIKWFAKVQGRAGRHTEWGLLGNRCAHRWRRDSQREWQLSQDRTVPGRKGRQQYCPGDPGSTCWDPAGLLTLKGFILQSHLARESGIRVLPGTPGHGAGSFHTCLHC